MSKAVKRRHTTLTLIKKAKIIKNLDQGRNISNVAECYGIGQATVYDIRKKTRTKSWDLYDKNSLQK